MSLSLQSSLRTSKVSSDIGNVAQSFRLFVSNPTCEIPKYNVDMYNRPVSIMGGNQFEGNGAPGCVSSLYRIEVENNIVRPQYSQYLNLPQGLAMTMNEYPNAPHRDLLGVNRDRAYDMNGVYQNTEYPEKAVNPNSDADFNAQMAYNQRYVRKYDQRAWLSSTETGSGF